MKSQKSLRDNKLRAYGLLNAWVVSSILVSVSLYVIVNHKRETDTKLAAHIKAAKTRDAEFKAAGTRDALRSLDAILYEDGILNPHVDDLREVPLREREISLKFHLLDEEAMRENEMHIQQKYQHLLTKSNRSRVTHHQQLDIATRLNLSKGKLKLAQEVIERDKWALQAIQSGRIKSPATPSINPPDSETDRKFKGLSYGKIIFNAPRDMQIGETKSVKVIITTDNGRNLLKDFDKTDILTSSKIRVSSIMSVQFEGDDFDIEPTKNQPDEQLVPTNEATEWNFLITPVKSGVLELKPVSIVVLHIENSDRRWEEHSTEESVRVKVNPSYQVEQFITTNWKWLFTSILGGTAGIGALIKWIWSRIKKTPGTPAKPTGENGKVEREEAPEKEEAEDDGGGDEKESAEGSKDVPASGEASEHVNAE